MSAAPSEFIIFDGKLILADDADANTCGGVTADGHFSMGGTIEGWQLPVSMVLERFNGCIGRRVGGLQFAVQHRTELAATYL